MIRYTTWIRQFKEKQTPIGDFARDVISDKSNYPRSNNYQDMLEYLENHNACYEAVDAFEETWYDYQCEQVTEKRLKWLKIHGYPKNDFPTDFGEIKDE